MRDIPPALARSIKLVILDVDGVLTDNGVYIGETAGGEAVEMKRFHILDGLGIKMLGWAGIRVALVSGRNSPATRIRAQELDIECHQGGGGFKIPACNALMEQHGITWSEIACVCDDLADLPMLREAGLPVAVANAVPEVKATAVWSTKRKGGEGAVREFAEALLKARGEWAQLVEEYVAKRQ